MKEEKCGGKNLGAVSRIVNAHVLENCVLVGRMEGDEEVSACLMLQLNF